MICRQHTIGDRPRKKGSKESVGGNTFFPLTQISIYQAVSEGVNNKAAHLLSSPRQRCAVVAVDSGGKPLGLCMLPVKEKVTGPSDSLAKRVHIDITQVRQLEQAGARSAWLCIHFVQVGA